MTSMTFYLVTVAASVAQERPELLQHAADARGGFKTAKIEYSMSYSGDGWKLQRFSSQYAGGGHSYVMKGFEDGCVYSNSADAMGTNFAFSEWRGLEEDNGRSWIYYEGDIIAKYSETRTLLPHYDIRAIGLAVDPLVDTNVESFVNDKYVTAWRSVELQDRTFVTASLTNGSELTWELNPAFDYQPDRITLTRADGGASRETRIEYDVFDERWWPARIEYYDSSGNLWMEFTIESAEFDRPDHPKVLTPKVLGLPVGANVGSPQGMLIWDGEGIITIQEAYEKKQRGELDTSEALAIQNRMAAGDYPGRFPKTMDGPDFGLAGIARKPRLWEEYVRRFIEVFALKKEQTTQAWETHKHWLERADAHLKSVETPMKAIDEQLKKLRQDVQAGGLKSTGEERKKEWQTLEERKAKLLDAIDKIFVEELRPSLFKLPTKEQKAVVLKREEEKKGSSGLIELLKKP